MNIPPVLYHGTTGLRLALMKRSGILQCNKEGHIYWTKNLDKAIAHGYTRYLDDKYSGFHTQDYEMKPILKDSVILSVKTKYLNRDYLTWYWHFGEIWYCHFGNIPFNVLSIHSVYPLPDIYDNTEYMNKTWFRPLINEHNLMNTLRPVHPFQKPTI